MQLLPIIMAGGSGTRLWPLSRELFSKQFLALGDQASMLQATVTRLQGLPVEQPLVVCNFYACSKHRRNSFRTRS